jgi:hypothetical protein
MANFLSTTSNSFAVVNNSALLSNLPSSFSLSGSNQYGLLAYNQVGFAGNYSSNGNGVGVFVHQQTGNLNQQTATVAVGKQLAENFSAGLSTNLYRFSSNNAFYQTTLVAGFSLGFHYSFEALRFGCNIQNPLSTQLTDRPIEKISPQMSVGMAYNAADFLTLNAELEQTSNIPLNLKIAAVLEYDEWIIRGGLNTQNQFGLGGGYKKNKLQVDIGLGIHQVLGVSPALNLSYVL